MKRLPTRPAPPLLPLVFLLLLTATTVPAAAQSSVPWTDWSVEAAAPDWRTWVAPEIGVALRLPQGHTLAGSGSSTWYLHGSYDGMPTVPDASLRWLPGSTLEEALTTFASDAIAEPWRFGDDATRGLRVVARGEALDGTAYSQAGYLIEVDGGVLRFSRYEGFDWAPFHAVAGTITVIRTATEPDDR